ncbi:serine palmitoyl CoA transferase subunit LcbA [Aspergillus luchuensis]|uniref:Serine palmitoyl CoA transferase subunit LcbA n=1 Tax=Aspergillus kawachii TaxID=1069201 RepID=A0A146FX05_ASPKA|nr:serine palmitoyl CoA transferase subunit LcbA [Aspergillus luchuensis]
MQNYSVVCQHSKSVEATKSKEIDVFRRYTGGPCKYPVMQAPPG